MAPRTRLRWAHGTLNHGARCGASGRTRPKETPDGDSGDRWAQRELRCHRGCGSRCRGWRGAARDRRSRRDRAAVAVPAAPIVDAERYQISGGWRRGQREATRQRPLLQVGFTKLHNRRDQVPRRRTARQARTSSVVCERQITSLTRIGRGAQEDRGTRRKIRSGQGGTSGTGAARGRRHRRHHRSSRGGVTVNAEGSSCHPRAGRHW